MSKPLIGLTAFRETNKNGLAYDGVYRSYVEAILLAGGAPVLIPAGLDEDSRATLLEKLDGILFPGGGDIAIEYFNGEPHPRVNDVDRERDELELALVKKAAENEKPFLGICRGFQAINVGLGGTLFTDLADQKPDSLKHDYFFPENERNYIAHTVEVVGTSRLAEVVGQTNLEVNSRHHQGVKDIAKALRPAAYAPDGLVEALELPDHVFGLAVQWHPENLTEQAPMQRLFRAFVEAAGKGK